MHRLWVAQPRESGASLKGADSVRMEQEEKTFMGEYSPEAMETELSSR